MVPVAHFLVVAAVLFVLGTAGVILSRNLIIMFMSIEIMLNAANLALIAFAKVQNVIGMIQAKNGLIAIEDAIRMGADGHVFVFLILTVAAAEAAVGLAIIIMIFRNKQSINADSFNLLKW